MFGRFAMTDEDAPEPFESDQIAPVELPIDGALDLHTFRPAELPELLPTYLGECRARGILEVRVVHGKGKGTLRRTVHALLGRIPYVRSFALAPPERGGWGATLVWLEPAAGGAEPSAVSAANGSGSGGASAP